MFLKFIQFLRLKIKIKNIHEFHKLFLKSLKIFFKINFSKKVYEIHVFFLS